jgi:hypothetical protein
VTVIVYAIGAVLVLVAVVAGAASRATLSQIVIVATVVAMIGLVVLLSRRAALQRALAEIRAGQAVVAKGPIDPTRDDVATLIDELRRLGFELVGATDTMIGARSPIRTWVMTEGGWPGTTWVEVGLARAPVVIFLSRAADGRFLETVFPDGATIDHPNVLTRPIETSLADAVAEHRAVLAEWTSRLGPPIAVRTLQDYRQVEPELRARTGGLLIAAHLERIVDPGIRRWAFSAAIGLITILTLVILTAMQA